MSNRQRNRKRNKHIVSYYWRGDIEDERTWAFPTKDAAWAHVVGEIRKRVKFFEPEENVRDHGPTMIDWEELYSTLFGKGEAEVVYCQCAAWWDNWGYYEKN